MSRTRVAVAVLAVLAVLGGMARAADDAFGLAYKAVNDLVYAKDYDKALVAAEKLIADFPSEYPSRLLSVRKLCGHSYRFQGKLAEALSAYQQGLTDYPSASEDSLAWVKLDIGNTMTEAGDAAGAQAVYRNSLLDHVFTLGAIDEKSPMWRTFEKVAPTFLTDAEWKTFLTDIIKRTKATEANAKFLGRVKSEIEKLK